MIISIDAISADVWLMHKIEIRSERLFLHNSAVSIDMDELKVTERENDYRIENANGIIQISKYTDHMVTYIR